MSSAIGPTLFAQEVMITVEENSTVIANWSPAVVLEYFQVVEEQRKDLHIFNRSRYEVARFYFLWRDGLPTTEILQTISEEELAQVEQFAAEGPVYIVEYDPLFLDQYRFQPIGNYFKLIVREIGKPIP